MTAVSISRVIQEKGVVQFKENYCKLFPLIIIFVKKEYPFRTGALFIKIVPQGVPFVKLVPLSAEVALFYRFSTLFSKGVLF